MTENSRRKVQRLRRIVGDAYTFVRSAEVNAAFETITFDDLMAEHIARIGEVGDAQLNAYNPYSFETGGESPASYETPAMDTTTPVVGNFVSGTNIGSATKMDRLLALENEVKGAVSALKTYDPTELADVDDYVDAEEQSVQGAEGYARLVSPAPVSEE